MAHAGTPGDLATRPAISAPGGHSGLWQALLVVVVTAAVVIATSFVVASKATTGGGAVDRGYDQIETLRGGATFSAASGDRSYDAIEQMRGTLPVVDASADDFQTLRGTMRSGSLVTSKIIDPRLRRTAPSSGTPVDQR
jgi:hypothetical protein